MKPNSIDIDNRKLEQFDYWHLSKDVRNAIEKDEFITPEDYVLAMDETLQRINSHPIPDSYKGAGKKFSDYLNSLKITNDLQLPDEEIYALDQIIVKTYYDAATSLPWVQAITGPLAKHRWQWKYYKEAQSPEWPQFTREFQNPPQITVGLERGMENGMGWMVGYNMGWQTRQESESWYDPMFYYRRSAAQKMGVFQDEWILRGTDGEHTNDSDLAQKGLFNYASLSTFEAGIGGDDNITATGDVEASIHSALQELKTIYQPGPTIIVSTANVFEEMFEHRNTYQPGVLDAQEVYQRFFSTGLVDAWYINERLYNAAVDSTHGQMMVLRLSKEIAERKIIYPFQTMTANPRWAGNIEEMQFQGQGLVYKNTGGAVVAADITATSAGVGNNQTYGSSPVMSRGGFQMLHATQLI